MNTATQSAPGHAPSSPAVVTCINLSHRLEGSTPSSDYIV